MIRFRLQAFLFAIAGVLALGGQVTLGAGPGSTAPFVPGQVAVRAVPDELVGERLLRVLPHAGISIVAVPRGREAAEAWRFRARGLEAGVNRIVRAFDLPNDPLYNLTDLQWNLRRIQSETAWDLTHGEGVVVAVADTGLASGGADGIGCLAPGGYDVVNDDGDPDDGDGHGTHVAGTIAQTTNNGVGVAGMSHGACILPVKVLDDSGAGTTADIAEGIHYAVDHGAKVINMSLGISARFDIRNDTVLDPALDYAYEKGVTVVCAAGNEGVDTNVGYPAIYPTTIAVGATDFEDNVTPYSNGGFGLDVVAPGGDTTSDLNGDDYGDGILQETRIDGVWGYYLFQGTSMAAPHVAAVAAMLIASDTATSPDDIYAVLTGTALDLGTSGYDGLYGHGLVQAHDALIGDITEPRCTDLDGDGYCVEEGDCDDANASVYPGAVDARNRRDRDGIDNDCDGLIDR
jgi:serine protease